MRYILAFTSSILMLSSCFISRNRYSVDEPRNQSIHLLCTDGAYNQALADCILFINGKAVDTSGADGLLVYDTICTDNELNFKVLCTDELHSNEYPNTYFDSKINLTRYIFYPSAKYKVKIKELDSLILFKSTVSQEELDSLNSKKLILPDEEAEFPGGNEFLSKYISENLEYPSYAQEHDIEGKVYIHFVIEKSGEITNIKVYSNTHPSLNQEAIRCIRNMPKWSPGKIGDRAVRTRCRLPIIFALN